MVGLVNKGSENGFIEKSRWPGIKEALHINFVSFLLEHKCGAPRITEAGWYQGQIKAMACADMESANICKRMVAALGEIYPGAKIEALTGRTYLAFLVLEYG